MRKIAVLLALLLSSTFLAAQPVIPIPIISNIEAPVAIDHAGDGSGRLFVLQRQGIIRIYRDGALLDEPFLDIQGRVGCCDERGLLGIAFHRDYPLNGQFFLNYTDNNFDTVIARYQVSGDANIADPASESVLLTIAQPFGNHNGGQLAFGPDGYLYIGMGDGGGAGDTLNSAQNPMSLLGKMLRIDVDGAAPYAIPPDNPFAADDFTLDEIWASGLRNPFRFSFDRVTGDLFIADVGQDRIEEVHFHAANTASGENYGWRLMEGSLCFNPASGCNGDSSLTLPAFEYDHGGGRCSITGGYRYRGAAIPALVGTYLYGDFCTGEILGAVPAGSGWQQQVLIDTDLMISSFGEDEAGEIYVADINGSISKLVAPVSISPASGIYFQSQLIDLALALRKAGASITTLTATLDGIDVSTEFDACTIAGSLSEGGSSLRCPGIPLSLLTPGTHSFTVELLLSDGDTVSDSVDWEILANTEQ